MKVLIDTNVLLSAALRDRLPEQVVLHLATHDEWIWLVTAEIVNEYVNVLARPKFTRIATFLSTFVRSLTA